MRGWIQVGYSLGWNRQGFREWLQTSGKGEDLPGQRSWILSKARCELLRTDSENYPCQHLANAEEKEPGKECKNNALQREERDASAAIDPVGP